MHNIYLTPRPSLSRVWVPVTVSGHQQLICKWTTHTDQQSSRPNIIDFASRTDEPPALAA